MKKVYDRRMTGRARPVAQAAAALAGVLAGGMVLIQAVLVPHWRATPPAEFRRWFTANVDRLRRLMVPLGAATGAVSVASAITQLGDQNPQRRASVAAAVATSGVIAITLVVNEPANHRFTEGPLTDGETRDLLRRWALWHHVRVVLGLAATTAATAAIPSRGES